MAQVVIQHEGTDIKTIEYKPRKADGSVDPKAPVKRMVLGSTVDQIDATRGMVGAPPFRFAIERSEYDAIIRASKPFKAYVESGVVRVGGALA